MQRKTGGSAHRSDATTTGKKISVTPVLEVHAVRAYKLILHAITRF